MPKRPKPEKLIQSLISETLLSYLTAVKNRRKALELCRMSFRVNTWEEKAPSLSKLTATFARVCDSMSHEILNLYTLEERTRQATGKDFRLVIEHVESPWRPEYAQHPDTNGAPPQVQRPETGQSEA